MNQNQKILYLINFNKTKTLFENKQIYFPNQKKILKEQMTGYFNSLSGNEASLLQQGWKNDKHLVLFWTSFAANFFGTYGQIAALGLDLTNAWLYHQEGNDFEAGLQVAFSVVPFGELAGKIPVIRKFGKKFFENILLKSTKGGVITKVEREAMNELLENTKWIKSKATSEILKKSFKQIFVNFRLPDIIKFMWLLQKKYPKLTFVSRLVLEIGGIYYTWPKLAKIFGITNEKDKNSELSKKIESEYNKSSEEYKEKLVEEIGTYIESVPQETRDSLLLDLQERMLK